MSETITLLLPLLFGLRLRGAAASIAPAPRRCAEGIFRVTAVQSIEIKASAALETTGAKSLSHASSVETSRKNYSVLSPLRVSNKKPRHSAWDRGAGLIADSGRVVELRRRQDGLGYARGQQNQQRDAPIHGSTPL